MKLHIKRAYDKADQADGRRILVDRLWPRGVTKAKAKIDLWAKEAAPSAALRKWFHHDTDKRYAQFARKYAAELKQNAAAKELKREVKRVKTVTLITAAKEPERSHVPTLAKYLKG
jgi:uncharacterized protein YeaO (DUF488 family)